jgi:hypothetical protein
MASEVSRGLGKGRALLLGLLVIVAVVGAIQLAAGPTEERTMPDEFVDDDIVEVAPLVPTGNLTGASWRTAEQVRAERAAQDEEGGGESVFEHVQWGEDDDLRAYDKSVEQTVREIDGLGVYVAPAETPAKKKGAK